MDRRMTRTLTRGAAIGALAAITTSCAGVRVYSDPAMRHETGIKVFAPKPYLLVSRTGARDKPVELSIVYLPDTKDALYIKQQRGWGSNDLGVRLTNGMLTDVGTKTDSRMPESLNAMGSLLTAAAGAYKTSQDRLTLGSQASPRDDLDDAAKMLTLIAQELVKVTTASSPATAPQAAAARAIADALAAASSAITDPVRMHDVDAVLETLPGLVKDIDGLKMDAPPTGNNRVTIYNSRIETLKSQLQRVIERVRAPEPPAFELYEIRQDNGGTRLVRVATGTRG
jgi:hypothetical protein